MKRIILNGIILLNIFFLKGENIFPFIEMDNCYLQDCCCSVPMTEIKQFLFGLCEFDCGKRQLQFLQYYAAKKNKRICILKNNIEQQENNYPSILLGNVNIILKNIPPSLNIDNIIFLIIPNNFYAFIERISINIFNEDPINLGDYMSQKHFSPFKKQAYFIGHELYHICYNIIISDTLPQKLTQAFPQNLQQFGEYFPNNDDDWQNIGCWFIGEFDYLQETFERFLIRKYNSTNIPDNMMVYIKNHQLDSFFIRPKFYENISCPLQGANTIAFLQQEDFLLEHFALEVPSDGNDAIWAVMQAYLRFNIDPEELLKDADMQTRMIAWRNMLAAKFQNIPEVHTRFSENHHRIKVEDFTYIAQTINRNIIVIEPEDIQFKITVFNDEGTYYSMNKLPKLDQKTLYIYYNGYNHYQPLLLSSRLDDNISLKTFLDQPANTLDNFLKGKKGNSFLETRFLNKNYRIEDVPGDGNCEIYAILRSLGLEINQTNNLTLRNEIFPRNHRMRTDRAWLGMEDLPHVVTYLQGTYHRGLIIVNASPVNSNMTNVILPDDHVFTRYVNGRWVRYDSLNDALKQETDTNPPVILLYDNHHFQAVVPKRPRRATIGNDGCFRVRLRRGSI